MLDDKAGVICGKNSSTKVTSGESLTLRHEVKLQAGVHRQH